MIPILDWIFEGIVGWVSSIASQLLDAVSGLFLEALGTDMTAMEEYFPFVTKAYGVMQVTAYAILILIVLWQIFRAFGGPITEAENPWHLVVRGALFGFLVGYAKPIFSACLIIARAPYTSLMDLTMTGEDFTFAGVEQALTSGLTTLVATASVVGLILILILLIALGWNYFKLLLETVERYIVVGVLCYTSPLAFSMGASKTTNNVFKAWCRMVGSQLLLLVMNVWFLRGFASSMGQFIGNGGALSTGKGSIFLWMFCALAYLKCAQRFDSYLASMGLNVAQTGSSMGMELLMAARVISGVGSGARSAGSVFGRAGGSATATGTGAAASGFAAGFASKFNPNSYVRDAVVDGGTRMGFSGGAGFVGRAFGGIAARNGATLNGQSISSVASRTPGSSGTIAGDIADRSLSNYMPHMQGFQMKGTQITGGHISTTATTPDGKKANVDMYSASQFEKPEAPHSVVTASDGSQWYQMASGEGRGAFYDAPTFGGMNANQAEGAGIQTEMPGAADVHQNMGGSQDGQNAGGAGSDHLVDQPGHVSVASEMPGTVPEGPGGMDGAVHLGNENGMPGQIPGGADNLIPGADSAPVGDGTVLQPGVANEPGIPGVPEVSGDANGEHTEFGAAFAAAPGAVPAAAAIGDTDEVPHPVGVDQNTLPGSGAEGHQFADNLIGADGGSHIIPFPNGNVEMPAEPGGMQNIPGGPESAEPVHMGPGAVSMGEPGQLHDADAGGMKMPPVSGPVQTESGIVSQEGEAPQFGAAFVGGGDSGVIPHEDGAGSVQMPAFDGAVPGGNGVAVPEGEVPQFGAAFVGGTEAGVVHQEESAGAVQMPGLDGSVPSGNGSVLPENEAPQFGAGFSGGAHNAYGDDSAPHSGGGSFNHNDDHASGGAYSDGAGYQSAYAEAPLVAATFPSAQEGTMLRTVGDGVIEASSPDGGNTLWYNSAYFQEPDAPHSVMEAANGVQWYAMQQQAQAPQFESGAEAAQYNQAAFQNFMPGYEGQVAHVDDSHRLDGHFEVRNADGSGTAFYDTARFAAPRGDYQVLEDARGSQWYAIRGEAAVERKPVFENGNPVYDDGKLRMENVATVRYRQTPAKFSEPEKRRDIDRKPPRRKQ